MLLVEIKGFPLNELDCLEEAIKGVIKSRNVLKCSYAYAYYMKIGKGSNDRDLFENWQGKLEHICENLHSMLERQFDAFLDPNILDKSPFYKYRSDLKNMSSANERFYQGMLEGI